ncbi:polyprenyl synthetase family protein [Streptomyces sp. NPDC001941]|uniref:polyprenyl synthetase family protein n=1 Tax=Streptomyces sp. NPDC001941 TaxID=3154659 RepID=UPI00331E259D
MTAPPAATPLSAADIRVSVEKILHTFLTRPHYSDSRLEQAVGALRAFVLRGGKRLRPLMCCVGHLAVAGHPPPLPVLRAAASLELFHAFALIHDDILDASDTRRGGPTLHRALAPGGPGREPSEAEQRDGIGRALLMGDLALVWSDTILHTSGLTPDQLAAVRPVVDAMRAEIVGGQYLDVATAGDAQACVETALVVIRYKTAKYTVERPLHLGAVLAGAGPSLLEELTAYALPLGEAFQLRDDLLGVFGDPTVTGKSRLDDLREGKPTVLIALAQRAAAPAERRRLDELLGRADLEDVQAEQIRQILTACGARRQVEDMIEERRRRVLHQLAHASPLHPAAVELLRSLADSATRRTA